MRRELESQIRWGLCATALASALAGPGCTAIIERSSSSGSSGDGAPTVTGPGSSTTGGTMVGLDGKPLPPDSACKGLPLQPKTAPIRRLSRNEFNNTIADLLFDTSAPGTNLPPEVIGNGFSNDAVQQTVSADLVTGYADIAADLATKATQPDTLAKLAPCAASATTPAAQDACAQSFITSWVSKAYRRPLVAGEADELLTLEKSVTAADTFTSGLGAVIEAVLQAPDFLYRPEFGTKDASNASLIRPTGEEMATRLSYLFWGSPPDDQLHAAAQSGELLTSAGILKSATRLLQSDKAHGVVKFFFDSLLPITSLSDQTRDASLYPAFSPQMGQYMRQETETFLDNEIFAASGSWPSVLTANYSFMNEPLAKFYGISGVTGMAFQKVQLDTTQRRGLLTQAAIMTGTTVTNSTNPVLRGSFVLNKLMCRNIGLPSDPAILAQVKVPTDVSGNTARERFSAHSTQTICQGCHHLIDPVGFALENYDAVGQYRTMENGEPIDASGKLPDPDSSTTLPVVNGAVQLAQQLADSTDTQNCFAQHWLEYGFGQTLRGTPEDLCLQEQINAAFKKSGYNVKQLLLDMTQTPTFQYLPTQE